MTAESRSESVANPLITILTPVYRPDPKHLEECAKSVFSQSSPDWKWVIVDDGSNLASIAKILKRCERDPRVTVVTRESNGGIVGASNDALAAATTDFVALLDHDDVLDPDAIKVMTWHIRSYPDADIFYSDRRHVTERGGHDKLGVFHKPAWSPERLRGNMYMAHLLVIKRESAIEVGGFREGFEGSQDHDLVLRVSERHRPIVAVPRPLYSWRRTKTSTARNMSAKPYALEAGIRAVKEHCERVGIDASPEHAKMPGVYHLNRRPPAGTKVSIIIPTRGSGAEVFGEYRCFATNVVRSVVEHDYSVAYEIIVVYDVDSDLGYLDDIRALAGDRLKLVPFDEKFNFSRKINVGALEATGDVLLMLNDDIEVITPNWLDHMAAIAIDSDVGVVGCLLLFENGSIQHAGIGVSPPWNVFNADWKKKLRSGHFGSQQVDHEVLGATGACLATRTSVFFELGGMCEEFPGSFNDVDYCFKAILAGYRNVTANSIQMHHFESMSRDPEVKKGEHIKLNERWRGMTQTDPYLRSESLPHLRQRKLKNNQPKREPIKHPYV